MLRLRPNLILPISALFLFGGCSSCFGPEDQQGCDVADSSCDPFCPSTEMSTTSSSPSCSDAICCLDENFAGEQLAGFVANRCGCAPFVRCADTCFANAGAAARCGSDGRAPNPLENTACVDCVLQGALDPTCASQAHADCDSDIDCGALLQCLDGVGWPEETSTSTGGSSSVSNTGGSTSSLGGSSLGGGGANGGGMSGQGGAGGSSGGGGHAARARR